MKDLSEIGERGLVVYFKDKYSFVTEDDWHKNPLQEPADIDTATQSALSAGAILANLDGQCTVLVNLDRFPAPEGQILPPGPKERPWQPATEDSPSVLFQENGTCYQIRKSDWKSLDPGFEGDAGVLVKRGALVAAIPRNEIPSGSYCVLVNLASIAPK